MMGHQSRQTAMLFVDIESLIPENHLLRKIERMVSFDFIYDLLAPYYPATGRPSVDPVSMFKMLLIGYLYSKAKKAAKTEDRQVYERSLFPGIFDTTAQEAYMENTAAYEQLFLDVDKYQAVMRALADRLYKELHDDK